MSLLCRSSCIPVTSGGLTETAFRPPLGFVVPQMLAVCTSWSLKLHSYQPMAEDQLH